MGNTEIKLPKPKIGEPCNGCGLCCHIQLCNTGAFLLKKVNYLGEKPIKGKCPALLSNVDGSFSCGLIKTPSRFIRSKYRPEVISKTVAQLVGSGTGCDELGIVSDDILEEIALDKMIERMKNDEAWLENQRKNVELLMKF